MSHPDPLKHPPYDEATAFAFKALASGTANDGQQKAVVDYILAVSGAYDLSYRPDAMGGDRATAFAEGKRFVGLQLIKMMNLPVGRIFPR